METKVIGYEQDDLAVESLKAGEVVAFPTETVFGLGVIASKKEAYEKLVKVKERTPGKPFTLMCSSISMAVRYAEIDVRIASIMKAFFPGELTLLLKARKGLPEWVTLGTGVVGIRVPNDKNLLNLIEKVGEPLLVPSANKSNNPPEVTYEGVKRVFNGEIALILKGNCKSKTPSTIADLCSNKPVAIRQGTLSIDDIIAVWNSAFAKVVVAADHGGFLAKEAIKEHLLKRGFDVEDVGTYSADSCDYPDFAYALSEKVASNHGLGVICCTSGEGVCIACNRNPNIRCGIGYDDVVTGKLREHNNANVVAFGQKYMALEDILRRVDIFLSENFSSEEKHHRRVNKL